ncbi:MAG: hypothetical protein RLZZ54_319 [Cyanobacteriota bacterium]|jgi:hypothetical protein
MSISAAHKKIYEILSPSHYQFVIPAYQRPYAWGKEQAKSLVQDLLDAFEESPEQEYFLGSIVVVKRSSSSVEAEVVDGQQRLTTLSILLAAIRSLVDVKDRPDLSALLISESANSRYAGLRLRSTGKNSDDWFFNKFIRSAEEFDSLGQMEAVLPSSQKCMRSNALLMRDEIQKEFTSEDRIDTCRLRDFLGFVKHKACLVIVASTDFESAYRIFSTMNNRGLSLGVSDLIKALILEQFGDDTEREYINQIWEQEEADLTRLASSGSDDPTESRRYFELLFSHIHRIKSKRRSTKNLFDDFKKDVLQIGSQGRGSLTPAVAKEFVESVLVESSDAYELILKRAIETPNPDGREKVNRLYLPLLENIGNSDWQPAAISFLSRNRYQMGGVHDFFRLLERTAAVSLILGENVNQRARRYGPILTALTAVDGSQQEALTALHQSINQKDAEQVLEIISGSLYGEPHAFYVMLRLDSALADGGISVSLSHRRASIEHVAPQTLSRDWKAEWNEYDHDELKNKIGNLVLLSRRKNSQAQNYDFKTKKEVYFTGRSRKNANDDEAGKDEAGKDETGKVAAFPSVTKVLNAGDRWTPDVVRKNQSEYVSLLKGIWDL